MIKKNLPIKEFTKWLKYSQKFYVSLNYLHKTPFPFTIFIRFTLVSSHLGYYLCFKAVRISSRVILYYMRYNTQFNTCAFMRMNHRHHPWDILMRVRGKVYDESTYLSAILPQNYLWYKDRLPISFRSHRHIHPNARTHTPYHPYLGGGWISRFNNNTLAVNLFYIHIWYM